MRRYLHRPVSRGTMFEFLYPNYLFILLLIIPMVLFKIFYENKKKVRIGFSNLDVLKKVSKQPIIRKKLLLVLRILTIVGLVIAIARPRITHKKSEITGKGIDIILAIDVSGSMKAIDFKPTNRLEAAKNVAATFISNRKRDRIGLVTFSDYAFTSCPITLDYTLLGDILQQTAIDEKANGTAIGLGLATAVGRIHTSSSKSKIVILLTDGRNNTGDVEPQMAAEIAKTFGIKVYVIGIGGDDFVDYPYFHPILGQTYQKVRIEIDMKTLNTIASITGTNFARRAGNTKELEEIFAEIDELEKSEYKTNNYFEYEEKFWIFLLFAFICLALEIIFRIAFWLDFP